MILGNSKGQNKGKKYFKEKDKCSNKCFPDKAEYFNRWFASNIRSLQTQLFSKYNHPSNEDVFNETYLRIHERIYFTGYSIADYKSYFCRAFYTNHIQELSKNNRFSDLELSANIAEDNNDDEEETDRRHRQLETDIFDYVYQNFDIHEYEIFKMYMRLKIQGKNMTYEILADIICNELYKPHHIQAIISRIKKEVADKFSERWDNIY